MTLEQLIQNRKSLTDEQEFSLISLLSYRCSVKVKEQVKKAIKFKFYSLFDGKEFSKRFSIDGNLVVYNPKTEDKFNIEVSNIRRSLLCQVNSSLC